MNGLIPRVSGAWAWAAGDGGDKHPHRADTELGPGRRRPHLQQRIREGVLGWGLAWKSQEKDVLPRGLA